MAALTFYKTTYVKLIRLSLSGGNYLRVVPKSGYYYDKSSVNNIISKSKILLNNCPKPIFRTAKPRCGNVKIFDFVGNGVLDVPKSEKR